MTNPTAAQVIALRTDLGLTQTEFADLCGISHYQTVSKIERGERSMSAPRWELLLLKLERAAPKKTAPRGAVKGA